MISPRNGPVDYSPRDRSDILPGVTEPEIAPHRSYSQRSEYLDCGWRYKLHRIQGFPERPAVWFAAGGAFHEVIEVFEHDRWDGKTSGHEGAYPAMFYVAFDRRLDELRMVEPDETAWRTSGRVSKDKPNKEDVAWWRVHGPAMVVAYVVWREHIAAEGWSTASINDVPCIEMLVETLIGNTLVRSYVDLVMTDRAGTLVVVDHKTGVYEPVGGEQLGLYSVQLEPLFGRPVSWGANYMARRGELSTIQNLTHYTPENLGKIYDMLDAAVKAEIFMPHISAQTCNGCGYREYCIWQGGVEPKEGQ